MFWRTRSVRRSAWESDQIGLEHGSGCGIPPEYCCGKGGNAASYVGYDKCFLDRNMVTGGETRMPLKPKLPAFRSKNGGSYRLEFDCTSGYDGMLPVQVCGADGSIYFSSKFDAVSEKTATSPQSSPQSRTMQRLLLSFSWAGKIPTMSHSPTSLW